MNKYSPLKVTLGCLLALALSVFSPYLLAFFIAPGILLVPVAICFLSAWSGPISAVLATVGVLTTSVRMGGLFLGSLCLIMEILPAWGAIHLLRRRVSMPSLVGQAILLQLAANLAGVIMLRLRLGPDMIASALTVFRESVEQLPALFVDSILRQLYQLGMFGSASGVDITRAILTTQDRATLLDSWFQLLDAVLRLALPASVLCSAALSGLLSAVLPSRICARRGDEPPVSYMGLHQWYLPVQVIKGLFFCLAVSAILSFMGVNGSTALVSVSLQLSGLGFSIQGLASLNRTLRARGMRPGGRIALMVALLMLARMLLIILGVIDALMGPRGLLMDMARKRMEKENNREDDER